MTNTKGMGPATCHSEGPGDTHEEGQPCDLHAGTTGLSSTARFQSTRRRKAMSHQSTTRATEATTEPARLNPAAGNVWRYGVRIVGRTLLFLAFAALVSIAGTPAAAQCVRARRVIAEAENIRVAVTRWRGLVGRRRPRAEATTTAPPTLRERVNTSPTAGRPGATEAGGYDASGQTRPRRVAGRKGE